MELVLNNPYRAIGLLVGAPTSQMNKHITRIPKYVLADQDIPEELISNGFSTLGFLERTKETIADAASRLNLDSDKMNAALFWFYNGNAITDEPAFDSFKAADQQGAIGIWTKLVGSGEVTHRNSSAFQNLSTLLLCHAINGTTIDEQQLEQGIYLKIRFLESDFVMDFKALATDVTFTTTKKELQLTFLNQVQLEVYKNGGITQSKFLEIINSLEFSAKDEFLKGFVKSHIEEIERNIEVARSKRKSSPSTADKTGKKLYLDTKQDLGILKDIWGVQNIKYSSISDKLADEILQCGIDYFKHYKDTVTDPGKNAMALFNAAKMLSIGNIAKQRCQENTENLQEWIDDKPERDKQNLIKSDLKSLIDIFQEYDNDVIESIENAKTLIRLCRPNLNNIKAILGSSDDLYLKLSTRVAAMVQHNIIEEVNAAQENIETKMIIDRYGTIARLKVILKNAWDTTVLLGFIDMDYDFKVNRYNTNKDSLRGLCSQLGVNTVVSNTSNSSNTAGNSTSTRQDTSETSNGENYWWIGAILGLIIGASTGGGVGAFWGVIIGGVIVYQISKNL